MPHPNSCFERVIEVHQENPKEAVTSVSDVYSHLSRNMAALLKVQRKENCRLVVPGGALAKKLKKFCKDVCCTEFI